METFSYNEERNKYLSLKHLFFPGLYGLLAEATIAVVALVVFNANELSNRLLKDSLDETNPLSFSSRLLGKTLSNFQRIDMVEQVLNFILWAVVGALVYILIFRSMQIILGAKSSVGTGLKLVRQEDYSGYMSWLALLHNYFVKSLVALAGITILALGAFVCFSIASQELRSGLLHLFPSNLKPLLLSFFAAILSVKLIVIGISLLSSRFRNWYSA